MAKEQHDLKLACSYCKKSQEEVRKLIAGPTVYICDECIRLCNALLAESTKPVKPPPQPGDRVEKSPFCCSFCGKNKREVRGLIAGPSVYICNECIGLCNDIIAEEIEREECATRLRVSLPEGVRALVAGILERGMPAAVRIQGVLADRITEDIVRRRAAGEAPDTSLWVPERLAADWRDLHDILARTTPRGSESGEGGPLEAVPSGWVSTIAERLAGSLEVLDVLARSLEKPGLEEVHLLHSSIAAGRDKLREAREMLLAGPSRSPEEPA